jgi:hypothetical protein
MTSSGLNLLSSDMAYEIEFSKKEPLQEQDCGLVKTYFAYEFVIKGGAAKASAKVVFSEAGVEAIEHGGKDPESAGRIALQRLLKSGRNPFQDEIVLHVPHGYAAHFARYGNFESLPVLSD